MVADRVKKIIQESGLSLPAFAKRTRVSKNTLINYRDGASYPNSEFLTKVCEEFLINPQWLLLGTGPMKAEQSISDFGMHNEAVYSEGDIRKKTAAAPRPPGRKAASLTNQDQAQVMLDDQALDLNPEPSTEPQGFKISDDLHKAARVLESGTAYAIALHLNIQQFDRALDDNVGIQQLKQTMRSMQITMAQESSAMRKEVEELKSQLARLLATGEDNPDHGQEVA